MDIYLEYFIKNIQIIYRFDCKLICYGKCNNSIIRIKRLKINNLIDFCETLNTNSFVWKKYNNIEIPVLRNNSNNDLNLISQLNNKFIVNYDIVLSTFLFLSGIIEEKCGKKDSLNRSTYNHSLIKNLGIINKPIVNYYFKLIYELINTANFPIRSCTIFKNRFTVNVTHDIDTCRRAWLEGSKYELLRGNFTNIFKLINKKIFDKDDWFNFKEILAIEKLYGVKATYFFLPQKGKIDNLKNADYSLKDRDIQDIIMEIKNEGHEIAIHGSFYSNENINQLNNEISQFSFPIIGNRFHFLMFDNLKTVEVLEKTNLKYDSTLGFAENIGFRRSICTPFYLFDLKNNSITDILEIPLIAMDSTLKYSQYMNLSPQEVLDHLYPIIAEIKKFNGILTILWHNTFFSEFKYAGWKSVFIEIIKYCISQNCKFENSKDIFNKLIINE